MSTAAPDRASIDASCRQVVVIWYASAVFWLIAGSLLALLASVKLHSPYFVGQTEWLTFGRVRPAHLTTMIYGWGSMAGVGTLLWLQARLSRVLLPFREMLYLFAFYWNAALAYGVYGILAEGGTSVEWLELPPVCAVALGGAFLVIFMASWRMLRTRRVRVLYVSQWYLLGAVYWFPFLYSTAMVLLFAIDAPGSVKAVGNWWFAHNLLGLWLTPIGVATAYYLIPKILGRPIYSYHLSIFGFLDPGTFLQLGWHASSYRRTISHLVNHRRHRWQCDDVHSSHHGSPQPPHDHGGPLRTVARQSHAALYRVWRHVLHNCQFSRFFDRAAHRQCNHALYPLYHRPRTPGCLRIFYHDHVWCLLLRAAAPHRA